MSIESNRKKAFANARNNLKKLIEDDFTAPDGPMFYGYEEIWKRVEIEYREEANDYDLKKHDIIKAAHRCMCRANGGSHLYGPLNDYGLARLRNNQWPETVDEANEYQPGIGGGFTVGWYAIDEATKLLTEARLLQKKKERKGKGRVIKDIEKHDPEENND